MSSAIKTRRGGYSLFSTYHRCQRQFYFRYIRRWIPITTNQKAAWGRVIHATSMDCYDAGLPQDPQDGDYWESRSTIYNQHVIGEGLIEADLINRGYKLLELWCKDIQPCDKGLRPILMDRLVGVNVDGWEFLFRPDRVLYDPKFNRYILHEVKSTMFSLDVVASNLQRTYQTTGYLWGFNQKFHANVCDVQPEIWYTRGNVYKIRRTPSIYRSPQELNRFGSDLRYWIKELNKKYEDPYEYNFPRCFQCTEGSNFKCDYKPICSQDHDGRAVPVGYEVKEDTII